MFLPDTVVMKDIESLRRVMPRIKSGELTVSLASKITRYSQVHIRNSYKQWLIRGDSIFIHGNKGRAPADRIDGNTRKHIVSIYNNDFPGYNFTFFSKCLRDYYDINFSDKTIYNILTEAGLKSPEARNVPKTKEVHRPRLRRQCEGELLQIDATPYRWFMWAGDTTYYALHGSIDDATGKLTALYLCEHECLYGYTELVRRTFYDYKGGQPAAIYSDRAAIFCVSPKDRDKLTIEEQLQAVHQKRTQWQRMLSELNVEQILAWSPQAKGRIERVWRTIQGRLPWYFARQRIKSLDAANEFLKEYVNIYNSEFGKPAACPVPVWHKTYLNSDYVLSARFSRRTTSAGTFSFQGYKWLLEAPRACHVNFELCVSEKGVRAYKDGEFYAVRLLDDLNYDVADYTPQVLQAILFKYFYKDMKAIAC